MKVQSFQKEEKFTLVKSRAGDVQAVKHLPSKHKSLSSNPSTAKQTKTTTTTTIKSKPFPLFGRMTTMAVSCAEPRDMKSEQR
jgi:hypothetical protein